MTPTEQEAERRACLEGILDSTAPKKLIVSGPGTGKTFTFAELLKRHPGSNLAVTFINRLADDLEASLAELAHSSTFHGYCRRLLHRTPTRGLTNRVDYYPALVLLQGDDLSRLSGRVVQRPDLERAFHSLEGPDEFIAGALRSGDCYDAVGHLDSVYRVLRYFWEHPEAVPVFGQIVVDEYQDFSRLEVEFIRALGEVSPLLVVGDDDQALYSFKYASADYIRKLADDPDYQRFELPFCSRCTDVLVRATHTVVRKARAAGLMRDRIEKRYECYLPAKEQDSRDYPKIVHADCTVDRNNAPYPARYIERRIREISTEDVQRAAKDGDPTVLIIGPNPFRDSIYDHLTRSGIRVSYRPSVEDAVRPLHGLRRLLTDSRSPLGWRILLYGDPTPQTTGILRRALEGGEQLVDLLEGAYRSRWLTVVDLLQRAIDGGDMTNTETLTLETATGMTLVDVVAAFSHTDDDRANSVADEPQVMLTSLVGAKGLQAQHVFVVGVNGGHFPRDNADPTDVEVCELLVALTRAQKSCTIISCRRLGNAELPESLFVSWLEPHLRHVYVNKAFLDAT